MGSAGENLRQLTTYLTQAVQSWEFTVRLVAGKDTLLWVFVTTPRATEESPPPVRGVFYVVGNQVWVLCKRPLGCLIGQRQQSETLSSVTGSLRRRSAT